MDIYFSKYIGAFARVAILFPSIDPSPESRRACAPVSLRLHGSAEFERIVDCLHRRRSSVGFTGSYILLRLGLVTSLASECKLDTVDETWL